MGFFYSLASLQILASSKGDDKQKRTQSTVETLLVGGISGWCVVVLVVSIALKRQSQVGQNIVGILSCIFAISFYAAPLSTMAQVVKTRDPSSLYAPAIIANMVNALMWFLYGLIGIKDPLVWVPNGIGLLLTLSQLLLIATFSVCQSVPPKYQSTADQDAGISKLATDDGLTISERNAEAGV